ncbi:hypothetical protein DICSQDRAFT_168932 [Dichomitus squalens LYAD-421 SS1]|uniref:uncharacterized protein n=1 Tax=Dichomitus squalens (strain LYAD-421) TaxID=732165 RepID=UPI0004414F42|nr:uncharacterized protein DICSQDRAFT_168932 [Dichomitus squalens LYAD-421 SS1]EJF62540.1 hypothetical protein DICSQDRAFT_168932 [Dichomitus squalens LYAD-421 SS1]
MLRTQRIAKLFGLANDCVLNFTDTNTDKKSNNSCLNRHCLNLLQLLKMPHVIPSTSAEASLGSRKQSILVLDGPGISSDLFAYPISWSARNTIAVACGFDVYYQELNSQKISHLCKPPQ